jgi:hypothetical protein
LFQDFLPPLNFPHSVSFNLSQPVDPDQRASICLRTFPSTCDGRAPHQDAAHVRWFLINLWLSFFVSSYKMFVRRSARNNPELISETSDVMPNFAGVEKFFTHMTFEASGAAGHSCRKQFSTRQILNAKLPEPGGGSTVERSDCED